VRDESADDVRLMLEPRSKNVDPDVLMGMLYRNSDLELRFSLNMNVLIDGVTPKVCSLKEVLRAFLDFRQEVLMRRAATGWKRSTTGSRCSKGSSPPFLNLDRVIDIIRYDDDPKAALMREDWGRDHVRATSEADYVSPAPGEGELSDVQVDAILNMRLRSLRRLEEMELLREQNALMEERAELEDLLDLPDQQWARIADQLRATRKAFGPGGYPGGARRTLLEAAGEAEEVPLEAMIDREPITVVCSQMGWVRAMTGHIDLTRELKYRDGDGPRFVFHAETTDRLLLFGSNGRFYTVGAANLPGGRGLGEPLRLMVDLPNEAEIVDLFVHRPGARLLVASSDGNGFVVGEDDVVAQTRAGKQVLNVKPPAEARAVRRISGDHVAIVSQNGKFLVFPLSELPEMTRGKGVRLQKYIHARGKQGALELDGGLSDIATFVWEDGLRWPMGGGKTRHEPDLGEWLGKRGAVGKRPPHGFPRNNRFT
jgi:topoisomerase-4 subunit A